MRKLLSGNEAIARGAYEAGVDVATGDPGTPSTEILENLVKYDDVYCQWSVNETVALEVAAGACFSGARCIVTMKHVGLNVAADPLMTLSYLGIKGGLVVAVADDPGMVAVADMLPDETAHLVCFDAGYVFQIPAHNRSYVALKAGHAARFGDLFEQYLGLIHDPLLLSWELATQSRPIIPQVLPFV